MSSSSSYSSQEEVEEGGEGGTPTFSGFEFNVPPSSSSTSSSRRRLDINEVWPAPFIEALSFQVAIDASRSAGRLAAAPAIFKSNR
ncbi:hypothetical protein Leryth_019146 [Lithospermum erythrorhizon]|nr:hypothetical protein Leryth_019146 [Lithospermum erythrorhizon]